MKEQGRILRSWLCALGIMLTPQHAMALVTWTGAATAPVIDDNLELNAGGGPIIIQDNGSCNSTPIEALTDDVLVTVVGGNATVQGNDDRQTILRLVPATGHTITFDLTGPNALTFLGSSTVGGLSRLLILHEGDGTVKFLLRGGNSLTLTNDPGVNGPVEFYLILEDGSNPSLQFVRNDLGNTTFESEEAYINIGASSLLSYASTDGLTNVSTGNMLFDPTNIGDGRMVMVIENTGAFTMAVQQAVFTTDDIEDYCSVNRNIPAGGTATTFIQNSNAGGGADAALMINNYNATYAEYLIDPYGDLGAAMDPINYSGSFDGLRYGVSAGANHILSIGDNSYLDYVGLANNICPTPGSIPGIINPGEPLDCSCSVSAASLLKLRNYSAFTIDGWFNPNSVESQIDLGVQSGIYFRSGVDVNGVVENPTFPDNVFTIIPSAVTPGAGEYVFDVEAPLVVNGSDIGTNFTLNSRLEILSLEVIPHDGPLFPVEGVGNPPLFLARDFAVDGITGELFQYNKAAWLINNTMTLINTALAHTDVNHAVYSNNDVTSEPTYVGGEGWWLSTLRGDNPVETRPWIGFIDSILQVQSSIALTGVDFLIPTNVTAGTVSPNLSLFQFYSNGYLVDDGSGRVMILGTLIGSQACDGCTIISDDAHLNIYQTADFTTIAGAATQTLDLTASQNNSDVNNAITTDIAGQTSIESIYLGNNSNISIGTNGSLPFINATTDYLYIDGNYFTIGTRGGSLGIPSTSSVTGQGGIFVDLNGVFGIMPNFIASLDVMVTKSQNGIVDLPPSQVFFSDQVGITDWMKNLSADPVIIPTGSTYSDYTLNWLTVVKNPGFMPYLIQSVNVCNCPPVIPANTLDIPVIQGEVDQLQIVNSRIGDPVHFWISGGWVREVLWISDCVAAEAPVAIIVLDGNGRLGLNNAHRNPDSLLTQTTLGVNGINIIANGSCRIDLNDDMIVNNLCAFIQGPQWADGDVLEIHADDPYTLYVTQDGVLDFNSFSTGTVRFDGNIRVVFEPGATLVLGTDLGSAVIEFGDQAVFEVATAYELQLQIQAFDGLTGAIDNTVNPLTSVSYQAPNNQYSPLLNPNGSSILTQTDLFRVRMLGVGTLSFVDNASADIRTNGILGVETIYEVFDDGLICNVTTTDVTLQLSDGAQFNIGKGNNVFGGSFQIGDVQQFNDIPHIINFTLTINGPNAVFNLGSGGFFGLGAGVARPNQGPGDNQSNVMADTLFSVNTVTLNLLGGEFNVSRIFNSDDPLSHSMVIGAMNTMDVNFVDNSDLEQLNAADFLTSGGGNFFLMGPGSAGAGNRGAIRLINRLDDGVINAPWPSIADPTRTVVLTRLFASILGSTELLSEAVNLSDTPFNIFFDIKTGDSTDVFGPATGLADAAPLNPDRFRQERTFGLLGYVDRSMIGRGSFQDVVDAEGGTAGERRTRLYELGAARVQIDTAVAAPGPIIAVRQIRSE